MTVFKTSDIAACGLNCGRCGARFRKKNPCPGCRAMGTKVRSVWFTTCQMRNCTLRKKPHCGGCGAYPCTKLKALEKRYGTKYATRLFDNLAFIRLNGIRRFLAKEEADHVRDGSVRCMHSGKWCLPP